MLDTTQNAILSLLGHGLFGCEPEVPTSADYSDILTEARKQAVLPLVYAAAVKRMPPGVAAAWRIPYYSAINKNIKITQEHFRLCGMLEKTGCTTVKGVASASYYPEPALRTMGDVDFFVLPDQLETAKTILRLSGFRETPPSAGETHTVFSRNDTGTWELHWSMSGIPENERGDAARALLEGLTQTSVLLESDSGCVRAPSAFHHGLILLIHAAEHITQTGIGLRHVCDWAVFVHRTRNFEALFREKLTQCGLWHFAQLLTLLSVRYLGLPEQKWVTLAEDPRLLESMILDIFAAGNFGKKDAERINEAKLITDPKRGGVDDTGMVSRFMQTLTGKAELAMPICARVKVLLPIGWGYVLLRHRCRIHNQERPAVHLRKMVRGAEKRRMIYKQFRLYEIDN